MATFWAQYWDVVAFYTLIVILLYIFRRKFEFQGIVALLRTKLGVKFMTETGRKHPKFWHVAGMVAIILGFLGMLLITVYLFYGLYALFFVPDAPPTLSPVIPGVKVPGVPFEFPLWYTLIGLFFAVVVHEAMHGIFSSAYNIKIKSSGFAFFGPLPGAFVEPDEKTMTKRPIRQQLAIFAAGPFANICLAVLAFVLTIGVGALAGTLVTEQGVTFASVQNDSAVYAAGITEPVVITAIDDAPVRNLRDLTAALEGRAPGEAVTVHTAQGDYAVTLGANPADETKPYLGILGVQNATELKNPAMGWLFEALIIVGMVLIWTYIISLGVGIANLLPLGPIDGGRMALLVLSSRLGEKKAKQLFGRFSMFMLLLVIVLVFVPILRALL